jgi:serine acetyltransferase
VSPACWLAHAASIGFARQVTLFAQIRADHARLRGGRCGLARLALDALSHKTFRVLCSYRLYRRARMSRAPGWRIATPFCLIHHRWTCLAIGAEIAWEAEIGEGCRILHGFGIVILPCAKIGRGVTLTHGTIVGYRGSPEAPQVARSIGVVEDDCFVGPYAMVWARMGAGSILSPHGVLTHDAPPLSVLAGSPARVVRKLGEPRAEASSVETAEAVGG